MENKWNQSEAIYAFSAWLTTRKEATKFGANYECSIICDRIKEFMDHYDLPAVRENYMEDVKLFPHESPASHWAIKLRKRLLIAGSNWWNSFIRNTTAWLEVHA